MIIIGCDFHPSFQQIAMLDTETGATEEHKLMQTSEKPKVSIGSWLRQRSLALKP